MASQELNYSSNPVHRNKTPGKTQWKKTISIVDEEEIFRFGVKEKWKGAKGYFSFSYVNKMIENIDSKDELNYAKFVGDKDWHGWPADQRTSKGDIPDYDILLKWVAKKYTRRSRINKLRRRQVCSI